MKKGERDAFVAQCAKLCEGKIYELNPDKEFLAKVFDGVMRNEETTGCKFCPCRLRLGNFADDAELLCPCNFEIQQSYRDWGRCWCGLFTKKKK